MKINVTHLCPPLRTSYSSPLSTIAATAGSRGGNKSPLRASSANAKQPPCHVVSEAAGDSNTPSTDAATSSPNSCKHHLRLDPCRGQKLQALHYAKPSYFRRTNNSSHPPVSVILIPPKSQNDFSKQFPFQFPQCPRRVFKFPLCLEQLNSIPPTKYGLLLSV